MSWWRNKSNPKIPKASITQTPKVDDEKASAPMTAQTNSWVCCKTYSIFLGGWADGMAQNNENMKTRTKRR
jgi:hypothetical protein